VLTRLNAPSSRPTTQLVLFTKYNWNDQVKNDEMGRAGQGGGKKTYRVLAGKPGRLTFRWGIVLGGFLEK
jgi:hypothetical protein